MNSYPSDPETGVCLSAGLACLSRHKEETGAVRDLQERDEGNIGSIITMLITDQTVDLDDYLTNPMLSPEGEEVFLANSIKQEETLCEAVSASPTSESNQYSTFRQSESEREEEKYEDGTYNRTMYPALEDMSNLASYHSNTEQEASEGRRDGKYWERRR